MQTQLRLVGLLSFASFLCISTMTAAAQSAKAEEAKPALTRHVGVASWYGEQHQGRTMANGQAFDLHKLTAASWYFPLGTRVRVVNLANGKGELVTITDRGPNQRLKDRIIDLSQAAASNLGYIRQGLTFVFVYAVPVVNPEEAKITTQLREPFLKNISLRSALQPINKPQRS